MNILEEQRNILFEACKSVATNNRCPEWISKILREAVLKAKGLKEEFPMIDESKIDTSTPIEVGDAVISSDPKDHCMYRVTEFTDIVQNEQLCTVVIIKGDVQNPINTLVHNVALYKLRKVK